MKKVHPRYCMVWIRISMTAEDLFQYITTTLTNITIIYLKRRIIKIYGYVKNRKPFLQNNPYCFIFFIKLNAVLQVSLLLYLSLAWTALHVPK